MWLESHAELRDHPKVDLLMDLLAVTRRDAVGLLHFVWWRAMTYAPSGDLSDFTDGQIARWADWEGDPGHLVSALKTAGFLDSQRTLHDWEEYAGRWIDRRAADAARKREARKAAAGRANGARGAAHIDCVDIHPEMSGGRPPGRRPESGVPDLTGPDLTGPDRTSTSPQPPPPAEGERTGRGKRRTVEIPEPTTAQLAPLDAEAVARWRTALHAIRDRGILNAGTLERLALLEPLGRDDAGGLHLRAPPGLAHQIRRFRPAIARALLDAGDAAAQGVVIVEG